MGYAGAVLRLPFDLGRMFASWLYANPDRRLHAARTAGAPIFCRSLGRSRRGNYRPTMSL